MAEYPKETRDPIADVWVSGLLLCAEDYALLTSSSPLQGPRTPYHGEGQWPVRVDEHIEAPVEKWVQSACVMCSNGESLFAC